MLLLGFVILNWSFIIMVVSSRLPHKDIIKGKGLFLLSMFIPTNNSPSTNDHSWVSNKSLPIPLLAILASIANPSKMATSRVMSDLVDEASTLDNSVHQGRYVSSSTHASQQFPTGIKEHTPASSRHDFPLRHKVALPFLDRGPLQHSTTPRNQTDKISSSSHSAGVPDIILTTPALPFRSQTLSSLRGQNSRVTLFPRSNSSSSSPSAETISEPLGPHDEEFKLATMGHRTSDFVLSGNACGFLPRGPLAGEMGSTPDSTPVSVPFYECHQSTHAQEEPTSRRLPRKQEERQIHRVAANGQQSAPFGLTESQPTSVPHEVRPRATDSYLQLHSPPDHVRTVPELYEPNRCIEPSSNLTRLEVAHHYLPFHDLPSLAHRTFGNRGPTARPPSNHFRNMRSKRRTSSSSASSSETVTPARSASGRTRLADLVRGSEPIMPNPKTNGINAEYFTSPSSTTTATNYLNHTAIHTPGSSTDSDLGYSFPGDRACQWTCASGSPPTQARHAPHIHNNNINTLPPVYSGHREIMATYTSGSGWRTMSRGSFAGTEFGAVGEMLVPLTVQEVGKVVVGGRGGAAANEDNDNDFDYEVDALQWKDLK